MHKSQEIILNAIKANPNATIRQLGAAIGENTSTAVTRYHLEALIKAGKIKRGDKWVVVEKKRK